MKVKSFFAAIFVSALFMSLFMGIFPNVCRAGSADGDLLLKNIYVSKSKNTDSYLIWFKFNRKPESIVKKLGLKGYSLELAFKNARSGISSKFIKFHNSRLFKAVEIIPVENSGLSAIIYFHKNIKITRKDTYATFYGSYFIIKINHTFSGDLFKNVGKEFPVQKNKIKQAVKTVNPPAPSADASAGQAEVSKNNPVGGRSFLAKHAPKLNMGFEAVKTTVYLALIIGLIYGVYFLMNKFKNRVSVKEKLNNLKIVSSINLGNKKSILLIEVNKEFFLVGVSQSNIQVIGHLKGDAANVNALYKTAESNASPSAGINTGIDMDSGTNTYAISEAGAYRSNASMPAGDAAFASPSPAIKSYGKFADAMREEVKNGGGGGINEPYRKIRAEQYADINKIKNINEAKFKNKADNVFFDIEERLKGLMESNGNSKKF